jgi:hypothetical protein
VNTTSTSTAKPKTVDGWNVAELAGGLLLSADDFVMKLDRSKVDDFLAALNSGSGQFKDVHGDLFTATLDDNDVILKKENDDRFPHGIVLPVEAFSELDDDLQEGIRPAFRRVGNKIKRGFRVTSGRRKGRVVVNPKTAFKPPIPAKTRNKLRIAATRKKFIRAMKSKLTRRKSASMRLRRLNHT